jgi:O-antigen/teichoic acid export membrane protein
VIVNAVFTLGTNAIWVVQGIALAAILPTTVYGEWGLLMAAFMTLLMLGSVGIDDKYIQQDDPDQQRAFEIAFTLQMLLGGLFVVVILVGMPLFALVYGDTSIAVPGMALAASIPAIALQMTIWAHFRRMDFLRARRLQAIDPVVTCVATIALALAGLDIWALVLGAMAGSWAASIAMVRSSPYKLRLRWDRAGFRDYAAFSWPLFLGALSTVILIQAPVITAARAIGVTAVAGIALANNLAIFTKKVDDLVTQTIYPAICAVKDRRELLFEAFLKSNRLALLWAAPLGAGVALFAGDFVHYVIGEKWRFAVPLIAAFGIAAVIDQIAFNWTAFFRALGRTRPVAVGQGVALVAVIAIAVPLLVTDGVTGFGVGMAIATAVAVAVRLAYLRSIFASFGFAQHVVRGIAPTLPAVAAVVGLRQVKDDIVLVELAVFIAVAALATWLLERDLLRESLGYLRRGRPTVAPV